MRYNYDYLKSAVLEGSGKDAVKQKNFNKLEAHYAFEGIFCNAASVAVGRRDPSKIL